ncbi:hypothetical protein TIFTF001_027680 [Ficus carica]|uniref:R13L1/DRL21-like LRR repeat region domain-containing protein n=1 Tax=Ficus carica TaxID=3494 RepID=A0AA88IYZ6_FICCA|nr:hypothetical protein TIFTF001_027680 [Ficus carica]
MKKVPDSIGKLKHLRYLDISSTDIVRLPTSITKLVNLQKLKLNYCHDLRELPNEIHKLVNLKHLEIQGCESLTHMPRGLRNLTKLQTLSLVVLSENIRSCTTYNHSKLDELMGLNNLRGELTIKGIRSGMETTVTKLRENKHLRSLYLYFKSRDDDASSSEQEWETTLEGLQPHTNLKELTLSNYGGATLSPLLPLLTNLVTLSLYNCSKFRQLPSLDKFHSLKKIELFGLEALEYITINEGDYNFSTSSLPSISVLPSLQKLTLHGLPNLRGWWRSDMVENQVDQVVFPSFPRLSSLRIEHCPKLTSMPCYPNVGDLTLVETSWKHFEQTMLVRDPQAQISATIAAEQASRPSAASSSITCSNIVSSYPLSKLTSLSLRNVTDVEYFPDERMKGLASLKRVEIRDCPALKYLSPWIQYLTSLEELTIDSCEAYEGIKWPETPTLTHLRVLKLQGLPKLKHLSSPGAQQHLTSLEDLRIIDWEELQVSNDDSIEWQALTTQRSLEFMDLPQLVSLPGGLQFLTTLKRLYIWSCSNLTGLPDWICKLSSLESLDIWDCPNFTGLPDWICRLSSLETLNIWTCPKFKSVPASISSLTSLQKLQINSKFMNPREIHEDLDLSCSASGPSSWKILNKFR